MDDAPVDGEEDQARRRPWFGLLVAAALLAAGIGAWMLGEPSERAVPRLLGDNQPVNPGARDPRDISANNSPAVARNPVDPTNLAVANRIDRPSFSCALHASFNGGASWEPITVPFPAGEEEPPRCFAPDVAYATDGTLYMSFVTLRGTGNVPNAVWVVSSRDGGRTLSVPVKAAGQLSFQVRLNTDASDPARVYLTWLEARQTGTLLFPETGYPIVTSTSIDGGATWSAPTRVSAADRERVVAPSPALGPNGERYVLYLDLLDDRLDYGGAHEGRGGEPYEGPWALVLARSLDQGRTWEETLVDGQIRPTERFVVFLPPTPALAVDRRTGRLYVAFTDGRAGDADVNMWTSSDGGRTFSPPVRVNDTPVRDGTAQYMPRLDVAPTGRVDVVYLDRRADLTNAHNEVSLQSSYDGGRTFTRRVRVSDRPFDARIGPGSERGLPDLGTRLALVSTNQRALAVWPDTRGGTELTSKTDLASGVVDIPPPAGESRTWLRVVGAVAVLLGLLALVLTLRQRRSGGGVVVLSDPSVARPAPVAASAEPSPTPTPPSTPQPHPAPAAAPLPAPLPHPAPAPAPAPQPAPSYVPVAPPAPAPDPDQPAPVPTGAQVASAAPGPGHDEHAPVPTGAQFAPPAPAAGVDQPAAVPAGAQFAPPAHGGGPSAAQPAPVPAQPAPAPPHLPQPASALAAGPPVDLPVPDPAPAPGSFGPAHRPPAGDAAPEPEASGAWSPATPVQQDPPPPPAVPHAAPSDAPGPQVSGGIWPGSSSTDTEGEASPEAPTSNG